MKILAITDYPFWTVGDIYDVVSIDSDIDSSWFTVMDDNGEVLELNSVDDEEDFEILD